MSIRAIYVYTDKFGRPVFRKVRNEPKAFRVQAALYKNDRLYWKGGPRCIERHQPEWRDRALYNLPIVLDALRYGENVFIVEGERDADAVTSMLKLPATTSYQGAKAFTEEQASWFASGRSRVHVVIDSDDPGHVGGWLRYQRLRTAGVSRKRLSVWRPGDDVIDITERLRGNGVDASALVPVDLGYLEDRAHSERARSAARDYMRPGR